eukprot:COSAG01_NODE_366_length_18064_cov_35.830615_16_plen_66_part_00
MGHTGPQAEPVSSDEGSESDGAGAGAAAALFFAPLASEVVPCPQAEPVSSDEGSESDGASTVLPV